MHNEILLAFPAQSNNEESRNSKRDEDGSYLAKEYPNHFPSHQDKRRPAVSEVETDIGAGNSELGVSPSLTGIDGELL